MASLTTQIELSDADVARIADAVAERLESRLGAPQADPERLRTEREVAKHYSVSPSTLKHLRLEGLLRPEISRPRLVRYSQRDVERVGELLRSNGHAPT